MRMPRKIGPAWLADIQLVGVVYEHDGELWAITEEDLRSCLFAEIDRVQALLVPTATDDEYVVVTEGWLRDGDALRVRSFHAGLIAKSESINLSNLPLRRPDEWAAL